MLTKSQKKKKKLFVKIPFFFSKIRKTPAREAQRKQQPNFERNPCIRFIDNCATDDGRWRTTLTLLSIKPYWFHLAKVKQRPLGLLLGPWSCLPIPVSPFLFQLQLLTPMQTCFGQFGHGSRCTVQNTDFRPMVLTTSHQDHGQKMAPNTKRDRLKLNWAWIQVTQLQKPSFSNHDL